MSDSEPASTGAGAAARLPADAQDAAGLQVLDRDECLRLLGSVSVGRIVFTDRALPAVQPVNFVLHDGDVVIRTASASKLAVAARNAVVAFEADELDPALRAGWSVTVVGRARVASDPAECVALAELPLRSWAPGPLDHFILVRPSTVSGRRIVPAERTLTAQGAEPAS